LPGIEPTYVQGGAQRKGTHIFQDQKIWKDLALSSSDGGGHALMEGKDRESDRL